MLVIPRGVVTAAPKHQPILFINKRSANAEKIPSFVLRRATPQLAKASAAVSIKQKYQRLYSISKQIILSQLLLVKTVLKLDLHVSLPLLLHKMLTLRGR